ncbi:hypothetical protein CFP56_020235, partial [Quercus suber]
PSSPVLHSANPPPHANPPHLILTIHDSLSHKNNNSNNRESSINHIHQNSHHNNDNGNGNENSNSIIVSSREKPYEFLGSKGMEVCGSSTVDPFLWCQVVKKKIASLLWML